VEIPEDVDAEGVEAQCFDGEQAMLPVLPGNACEVNFSSIYGGEIQNIGNFYIGRWRRGGRGRGRGRGCDLLELLLLI
jgi:hypothetical protein